MEFKTLFYIVVGLAWFIWKGLESSRKHRQQRPLIIPPVQERPVAVQPPSVPRVQFRRPPVKVPVVNYEETSPGFREGGSVRMDFGTNEAENTTSEGESYAQKLAERWKNGEIDFRDVVVLSELMRPVHSRS